MGKYCPPRYRSSDRKVPPLPCPPVHWERLLAPCCMTTGAAPCPQPLRQGGGGSFTAALTGNARAFTHVLRRWGDGMKSLCQFRQTRRLVHDHWCAVRERPSYWESKKTAPILCWAERKNRTIWRSPQKNTKEAKQMEKTLYQNVWNNKRLRLNVAASER